MYICIAINGRAPYASCLISKLLLRQNAYFNNNNRQFKQCNHYHRWVKFILTLGTNCVSIVNSKNLILTLSIGQILNELITSWSKLKISVTSSIPRTFNVILSQSTFGNSLNFILSIFNEFCYYGRLRIRENYHSYAPLKRY